MKQFTFNLKKQPCIRCQGEK